MRKKRTDFFGLGTLLADVQFSINQYAQVLFLWTVFQLLCPKPVGFPEVIGIKVHWTQPSEPACPDSSDKHLTPRQINTLLELGVICKLTEGALSALIQVIKKDIEEDRPQH